MELIAVPDVGSFHQFRVFLMEEGAGINGIDFVEKSSSVRNQFRGELSIIIMADILQALDGVGDDVNVFIEFVIKIVFVSDLLRELDNFAFVHALIGNEMLDHIFHELPLVSLGTVSRKS